MIASFWYFAEHPLFSTEYGRRHGEINTLQL